MTRDPFQAHVPDARIHGDLISGHTSHCLRAGDTSRSFVISRNPETAAVPVWCSCSCSEYIILVLHRGRPRPSKGTATKTTYIFSTQFQTLKGKRDPRPGPASIIPSTNTLLSRALASERSAKFERAGFDRAFNIFTLRFRARRLGSGTRCFAEILLRGSLFGEVQ